MSPRPTGPYLNPEAKCRACYGTFPEHEILHDDEATADRTPADFDGAQLSGVWCPR